MYLIHRPALLADLRDATQSIRDHFIWTGKLKSRLLSFWTELLSSGSCHSAVILDSQSKRESKIIFFGIAVFPTVEYAEQLRLNSEPFIARRVMERCERGEKILLNAAEIATGNANGGLTYLTLHSGMPQNLIRGAEGEAYRTQLNNYTYLANGGFQIDEYLMEMYGDYELQWGLSAGMSVRDDFVGYYARNPDQAVAPEHHPRMMCLTADTAMTQPAGQLRPAFGCARPRFYFRPAERRLLQFALSGYTDEEIAPMLSVAFATIRKRWEAIYERVTDSDPALLDVPSAASDRRERSSQKRRRLLGYLRHHVEELRPYDKPK